MFYSLALLLLRFIALNTMRARRSGVPRLEGGYLLACAHISHLDPFAIGALWPRKVGWMARIEFYRRAWAATLMRWLNTFPVHRQGVPVRAIREALARLARGEVVGVFPEGELKSGADSVLRGGPIKRGVCLLSMRSGRPIVPCVMIGTEKLLAVGPYLPFKRGRLWLYCGEPITPAPGLKHRAGREWMAEELERRFVQMYAELRERWGLPDSILP